MLSRRNARRSAKSGMAYVAVLILLMLASTLALAFSYRVGSQIALVDQRANAMQANYLAESAANHAVWRMLSNRRELQLSVSSGADDAIEVWNLGTMDSSHQDVHLGWEEFGAIRLDGVGIPQGSQILSAQFEFVAFHNDSQSCSVNISAEASDDSAPFGTTSGYLSGLPQTTASVDWSSIEAWTAGSQYQSPELRIIIQELVNRPGWAQGNALTVLFETNASSVGKRGVTAYETSAAQAPKLTVTYENADPFTDPDNYYFHALADGRYGYKLSAFSDSTLGSISTVGAKGDVVTRQSYVLAPGSAGDGLHPCLEGWWALDESWGQVAADESSNALDGSLTGMIGDEWATGAVDGGLDLAAVGARVNLGNSPIFALSDALAISLWVKPNVIQFSILVDKGFEDSFYFMLLADGSFKLASAASGDYWEVVSDPGEVIVDQWQHLAVTFDQAAGTCVLYKNGVEVKRATGLTKGLATNSDSLMLGAGSVAADYPFDGVVDDLRVYSCALSDQELAELYCAAAAPIVSAGADECLSLIVPEVPLVGSATDPCPLAAADSITTTWSTVSGPGSVVFADSSAVSTTASFSVPGSYILRLTATNGMVESFDELCVEVIDGIYIESYESWAAASAGSWTEMDLSAAPYHVPPNAVVEVAIVNSKANASRFGGVRAKGSSLDRRLDLHEAESGGESVAVMQVATDATSLIECYAENTSEVDFVLLGIWLGGSYQERFSTFTSPTVASWASVNLGTYGVGTGAVAEVVLANTDAGNEQQAGVRPLGFSGERLLDLREAENGGVTVATMLATADLSVNAQIQVYAEDKDMVEFVLLGFWDEAPGTFTDQFVSPGAPNGNWTDTDLSSAGVPDDALVQLALGNATTNKEVGLGARATGTSLSRSFNLVEAESGGVEVAVFHVQSDNTATIEWYRSTPGSTLQSFLLGWWTP